MKTHIAVILVLGFTMQANAVEYSLGVDNGSKATVDNVHLASEEIKYSREWGILPVGINKYLGVQGHVPKKVLIKWRQEDKLFSEVVIIADDIRQRVKDRSRSYIRILGDGKAIVYVEIIDPLDLTKRTFYPPEYTPQKEDAKKSGKASSQ